MWFCRGIWNLNGSIQTLFRGILKSLNILIATGPSDSSSKMSQKTGNIKSGNINFNALLRKYSLLNLKSDWPMWKRTSWSISLGIMKVYLYGFDRGFHNPTKSVKSTFIKNQKPYVVLEEFLYKKHIFFQILLKNNVRYCAYYIRILSKQCMVSDFW